MARSTKGSSCTWWALLPASELLDDQLPLHITAESVHLEHLAVIEGREVVDVDLPGLGSKESRGRGKCLFRKISTMWFSIVEGTQNLSVSNLCSAGTRTAVPGETAGQENRALAEIS